MSPVIRSKRGNLPHAIDVFWFMWLYIEKTIMRIGIPEIDASPEMHLLQNYLSMDTNMNWLKDVESRIKRKNQVLFAKNSEFLVDLVQLIQEQHHRTLVLWAFEFADETVQKLCDRYPKEKRLESAVLASKEWAAGKVKMPVARRAILQAHKVAREIDSPQDIALCHAIGQACGVVHANGHAIGFAIYDLTAIIRKYGVPQCKNVVEERKQQYIDGIHYWREHYTDHQYTWADFMVVD